MNELRRYANGTEGGFLSAHGEQRADGDIYSRFTLMRENRAVLNYPHFSRDCFRILRRQALEQFHDNEPDASWALHR